MFNKMQPICKTIVQVINFVNHITFKFVSDGCPYSLDSCFKLSLVYRMENRNNFAKRDPLQLNEGDATSIMI